MAADCRITTKRLAQQHPSVLLTRQNIEANLQWRYLGILCYSNHVKKN